MKRTHFPRLLSDPPMPRYRIDIEYDGTPFHGWQRQNGDPNATVQGAIERALEGFCGRPVTIRCAGRTDRGVHALAQTAHFDLDQPLPPQRIREASNAHLRPLPISILACHETTLDFHARLSARQRHYRYIILMRPAPPALARERVWFVRIPLDLDSMNRAAQQLCGQHDFTTFRSAHCQANSPVKNLDRCTVTQHGDMIHIDCAARSFLHHQIRSIVGSLQRVGSGRWSVGDLTAALNARDRSACAALAPPWGLYLHKIDYGDSPES